MVWCGWLKSWSNLVWIWLSHIYVLDWCGFGLDLSSFSGLLPWPWSEEEEGNVSESSCEHVDGNVLRQKLVTSRRFKTRAKIPFYPSPSMNMRNALFYGGGVFQQMDTICNGTKQISLLVVSISILCIFTVFYIKILTQWWDNPNHFESAAKQPYIWEKQPSTKKLQQVPKFDPVRDQAYCWIVTCEPRFFFIISPNLKHISILTRLWKYVQN